MQGTIIINKKNESLLVTETGIGANCNQIFVCDKNGNSKQNYIHEILRYANKNEVVKFVSDIKGTHPHMIQHLIKFVEIIEKGDE